MLQRQKYLVLICFFFFFLFAWFCVYVNSWRRSSKFRKSNINDKLYHTSHEKYPLWHETSGKTSLRTITEIAHTERTTKKNQLPSNGMNACIIAIISCAVCAQKGHWTKILFSLEFVLSLLLSFSQLLMLEQ